MMSDHDKMEAIFMAALEIQTDVERRKYIEQACSDDQELRSQVEKLVEGHFQAGSFLGSESQTIASPGDQIDRTNTRVGHYLLLRKIGEGGMGSVYLAEQSEPFHRRVAVKVIRAGMDSQQVISRFQQERQALAVMDHPNIARVFDGGLTVDGRPYFAMELIEGLPITDYCDRHRSTLRQRLELFMSVCLAIQHAHQKGIIHRDLKPSNVLVTETDGRPTPKVIDFGVAKALRTRLPGITLDAHLGVIVGTLEYMSPEQAVPDQDDIDTRSDIYCLGVLLFELLTGTTPLQRQKLNEVAVLELLRVIREEETPKPSHRLSSVNDLQAVAACRGLDPKALRHVLKGDLDWIVIKCLEKDRNRRYWAASAIARDIERYLNCEPIEAGPPGTAYRMRKFLIRNRWGATAVGLLMLTLIGGIVGTSVGLLQASRSRAVAEQALQTSEQHRDRAERHYQRALSAVDRLLTRVGGQRLESVPLMDQTRRQLLEDALEFYRDMLNEDSDDPQLRREVGLAWFRTGDIQSRLGNTQAEASLSQAIEIQQKLIDEFPDATQHIEDYICSCRHLAIDLYRSGRINEAEQVIASTLERSRVRSSKAILELVRLLYLRAYLYAGTQRSEEATLACRESLQLADGLLKEYPTNSVALLERARVLSFWANLYRESRRLDEAEKYFLDSKDILNDLVSKEPHDTDVQSALGALCCNLGLTYANLGRIDDSMTFANQAISIFDQLTRNHPGLPDFKWLLARNCNNVALLHSNNGAPEKASLDNQKVLAIFDELRQQYPQRLDFVVSYIGACGNQGKYCGQLGLHEESIAWNSKAIDAADALLQREPRHTETLRSLHGSLIGRAGTYRRLQREELALADYLRSLPLSQGQRHPSYVNFRPRALAFVGQHRSATEEAEAVIGGANASATNFSEMAGVYATCVETIHRSTEIAKDQRVETAERFAVRSLELLAKAAEKGRYSTLEDVDDLRSDYRFKAIRDRDDFNAFLIKLEESMRK